MERSGAAHVLVVADKTAATQLLADALRERADKGPCRFHLLIPNPKKASWHLSEIQHPDLTQGQQVLALALPVLKEACDCEVYGSVSVRHDPMDAIEDAIAADEYDEIIVSTLPHHVSMWLHADLPHRAAAITHLPVTTVTATGALAVQ
jgi:hypothetical protein